MRSIPFALLATYCLTFGSHVSLGQDVYTIKPDEQQAETFHRSVIVLQDPDLLLLNQGLMQDVLYSIRLQQIARGSLGEDVETGPLSVRFQFLNEGDAGHPARSGRLTLVIKPGLTEEFRQKLWTAVVDEFSDRLEKAVGRIADHRNIARKLRVDRVEQQIEATRNVMHERLEFVYKYEEQLGSALSVEQLRARIQQLSTQASELRRRQIASEVRQSVAKDQIEKMQAKAEQQANDDPVLQELIKLVRLRGDQLAMTRTLWEQGNVNQSEVAVAEAAQAEARIKMLEQKQKQIDPGLASQISTLNVRLADGMTELLEARTLQKQVEKELAELQTELSKKLHAHEKEWAQISLDLARQRLIEMTKELEELEAQRPQPFRVRVISWVD